MVFVPPVRWQVFAGFRRSVRPLVVVAGEAVEFFVRFVREQVVEMISHFRWRVSFKQYAVVGDGVKGKGWVTCQQ